MVSWTEQTQTTTSWEEEFTGEKTWLNLSDDTWSDILDITWSKWFVIPNVGWSESSRETVS